MARRRKKSTSAQDGFAVMVLVGILIVGSWIVKILSEVYQSVHLFYSKLFVSLPKETIDIITTMSPIILIGWFVWFYKKTKRKIRNAKIQRMIEENHPSLYKSRMFVYLWEDTNTPGEIKFGEHYVSSCQLEEGLKDTISYIRSSLARQKYKFDRGDITIHMIEDATVYAEMVGKMYKNSKLDDHIRKQVLKNRISNSEFHRMNPVEMEYNISKLIGA